MAKDATITFRLPAAEKARWQGEADRLGVSIGEYIRSKMGVIPEVEVTWSGSPIEVMARIEVDRLVEDPSPPAPLPPEEKKEFVASLPAILKLPPKKCFRCVRRARVGQSVEVDCVECRKENER